MRQHFSCDRDWDLWMRPCYLSITLLIDLHWYVTNYHQWQSIHQYCSLHNLTSGPEWHQHRLYWHPYSDTIDNSHSHSTRTYRTLASTFHASSPFGYLFDLCLVIIDYPETVTHRVVSHSDHPCYLFWYLHVHLGSDWLLWLSIQSPMRVLYFSYGLVSLIMMSIMRSPVIDSSAAVYSAPRDFF